MSPLFLFVEPVVFPGLEARANRNNHKALELDYVELDSYNWGLIARISVLVAYTEIDARSIAKP